MDKVLDFSGRQCECRKPFEDEEQEGLYHCGYHCDGRCSGLCCYIPDYPYCSNMKENQNALLTRDHPASHANRTR